MKGDKLPPCRLCGGEPVDKGFGISCRKCGLWLGKGTLVDALGGYRAVWRGVISASDSVMLRTGLEQYEFITGDKGDQL